MAILIKTVCISGMLCLALLPTLSGAQSKEAAPTKPAFALPPHTNTAPRSGFLSWFSAVLRTDLGHSSTGISAANRASTATVGIRGLGEDGATAAKSHSEELQKLKLYSVSRSEAEEFAQNAALTPTKVAYID